MAQMNNNQMNNNQMNNRNMQANKPMENHSWAIKELTRNDVLATNQWPIKVVRDEGKQTKMEIRSITDLNKSFEGTRHNLLQCLKVRSRYTLLYDELMKHSQDISNISHLAITYDTVYYLVNKEVKKSDGNIENKPEFKCFTFGTNIFNEDDIERVTNGILLSSGYFDYIIKNDFNNFNEAYKQLQAESKQMKLKDTEFRTYVKRLPEYNAFAKTMSAVLKSRQKLKVIDNVKPLIDVLKSELNFTNLEYLFFIPYPNEAVDYSEVIKLRLLGKPYNLDYRRVGVIAEELKKVPSLSIEEPGFNSFIDELRQKKHHRTIRKAYLLKSNDVTPKAIYNLFLNVNNSNGDLKPIYVSDAEQAREERKTAQKLAEENQVIKEYDDLKHKVTKFYSEISEMIISMNSIMRICDNIHNKGVDNNNVEYDIWVKEYKPSLIKNRIDAVYEYRTRTVPTDKEKYPICKLLKELNKNYNGGGFLSDSEVDFFDKYLVPPFYKNDGSSLDKTGIQDLKNIENLKKLSNVLEEIKKETETLFEVFQGVQYATFGVFMKRYGLGGMMITKILIKDFVEKHKGTPFILTDNVKECANEAFYKIYTGIESLAAYDATVAASSGEGGIGRFAHFVVEYLKEIAEIPPITLEHSHAQDKENTKYENLFKSLKGVQEIVETCENLVHAEVLSDENRMKMAQVIKKYAE